MGEKDINSEFRTSIYSDIKPVNIEKILGCLIDKDNLKREIPSYRKFDEKGIINFNDYNFITDKTFDFDLDSDDARKKLRIIEDYFNTNLLRKVKVGFATMGKESGKWILYNPNRFDNYSLKEKMREIFY